MGSGVEPARMCEGEMMSSTGARGGGDGLFCSQNHSLSLSLSLLNYMAIPYAFLGP